MGMHEVVIIGGGPAGLRVMQMAAEAGVAPVLFDQMRSVGRKFLVAGKSGLNLTNDAPREMFLSRYRGTPGESWTRIYDQFTKDDLRQWALDLGQETFVSSGQKVFPASMKAAPLLRRWVQEIKGAGGQFAVQHRLMGITPLDEGYELSFATPDGEVRHQARQVVLAMGGGSWPQTGSDGKWAALLEGLGIPVAPLVAANAGWEIDWPAAFIAEYDGTPWKNITCRAGEEELIGELVVTRYGLEGGPVYRLGHALRQLEQPVMVIDFKSSFTVHQLVKKAESAKRNLVVELARRWKLSPSVLALIAEWYPEHFADGATAEMIQAIAELVKALPIPLLQPRPIAEAISSAGGVLWEAVDETLQLRQYEGIYLCGEMLNWEAPTGGFLLQGCFASATWVARALLGEQA